MSEKAKKMNATIFMVFLLLSLTAMFSSNLMRSDMIRYSTESVSEVRLEEGKHTIIINLFMVWSTMEQVDNDGTLNTKVLVNGLDFDLTIYEEDDATSKVTITPLLSEKNKLMNGYVLGEFEITETGDYIIDASSNYTEPTSFVYYIGDVNFTLFKVVDTFARSWILWMIGVLVIANVIHQAKQKEKKVLDKVKEDTKARIEKK